MSACCSMNTCNPMTCLYRRSGQTLDILIIHMLQLWAFALECEQCFQCLFSGNLCWIILITLTDRLETMRGKKIKKYLNLFESFFTFLLLWKTALKLIWYWFSMLTETRVAKWVTHGTALTDGSDGFPAECRILCCVCLWQCV